METTEILENTALASAAAAVTASVPEEEEEELSFAEEFERMADRLAELEKSVPALRGLSAWVKETDRTVRLLGADDAARTHSLTVDGYAWLHNMPLGPRLTSDLDSRASMFCMDQGINPVWMFDRKRGRVRAYPEAVLERVFSGYLPEGGTLNPDNF